MIRKSFGRRICNSRLQVNTPSTFRSVASVIFICRKTKNDFYNLPRAISQSLWICHHNAVAAGRMPLPVVLSGGGSGAGSASGNPSRSLAPSQRAPLPAPPQRTGRGEPQACEATVASDRRKEGRVTYDARRRPRKPEALCLSKAADPTGNRAADLPLPPLGNGATQLQATAGDRTDRRAG